VIRPAAFCGVYGFKPTHGLISRHGILKLSRTLDHVGFFARTLEDIALLAEQLVGHDEHDPDTALRARIPLVRTAAAEPPLTPKLAFVKTPVWDRAAAETREAFAELTETLGAQCEVHELPESLREAWDWQRAIMEAEMAANLDREWQDGRERLSNALRAQLARGREVKAIDYQKALPESGLARIGGVRARRRVLTPAAAEPRRRTGVRRDPAFCSLWTLCGMPALNLPLLKGENGLPMGVQLVSARGDDARLLRTARWLVARAQSE
jgi:Asp-tRNA(Asn)/Glu-tRNA(Gln) amidotransferase A subunit family amidase